MGDASAFEELARSRLPGTFRIALAITGSEAQASELVRELWLTARQERRTLGDPAGVEAWLDRLLVRAYSSTGLPAGPLRETAVVEEVAVRRGPAGSRRPDEWPLLERAFDALTLEQRTLLVLESLEGWPLGAIAAAFEIPAAAAASRMHAAHTALDRRLATDAAARAASPELGTDEGLRAMLLDRATLRMPPDLVDSVLGGLRAGSAAPPRGRPMGRIALQPGLVVALALLVGASALLVTMVGRKPQLAAAPTGAPSPSVILATTVLPSPGSSDTAGSCADFNSAAGNGGMGTGPAPVPGARPLVPTNGRIILLNGTPASPTELQPSGRQPVLDQIATWGLRSLAVSHWAGSADGSVIAADLAERGCAQVVWAMNADGTGLRAPFESLSAFSYGAAWSPDGRLAAAVGGNEPSFRNGSLQPTSVEIWSPATQAIESIGRPCAYCAANPEPTTPALRWSPDGTALAVELLDPACSGQGTPEDTSGAPPPCPVLATFTSDGTWHVILDPQQSGGGMDLLGWLDDRTLLISAAGHLERVDVEDRGPIPLASEPFFDQPGAMVLSPDGARVAVLSFAPKAESLTLDVATGRRIFLAGLPSHIVDATWSPDSQWLLVRGDIDGFGTNAGIYRVPADGTSTAEYVLGGTFGPIVWLGGP